MRQSLGKTCTLPRMGAVVLCLAVLTPSRLHADSTGDTPMPQAEEISGVFLGPGVECPQLRLPDGEQISLQGGDFAAYRQGDALRLGGRFVMMSTCMQGRAFAVSAILAPEEN